MRKHLASLSCLTAVVTSFHAPAAVAEMTATPVVGDSRLVDFEYDEDNVYLLITRPKRSTFIRFAPDEKITYVSAGDSKNFDVVVAASFEFMEVKPKFENMETNITVVTSKRTYQMVARSTFDGGKWYARVTWKYPQVALLDLTKGALVQDAEAARAREVQLRPAEPPAVAASNVAIEHLNFSYTVTGDAEFRPQQVFDDGTFTYIRLAKSQELPALFMVPPDDKTATALVNYDVRGEYLVAQRVMKAFVLKLGKSEVRVEAGNVRQTSATPIGER
jgi:P-type conjugative transfer protein VirB9